MNWQSPQSQKNISCQYLEIGRFRVEIGFLASLGKRKQDVATRGSEAHMAMAEPVCGYSHVLQTPTAIASDPKGVGGYGLCLDLISHQKQMSHLL